MANDIKLDDLAWSPPDTIRGYEDNVAMSASTVQADVEESRSFPTTLLPKAEGRVQGHLHCCVCVCVWW